MEYTKNYKLKKPSGSDKYNIDDFNYNTNEIDTVLNNKYDKQTNGIPKDDLSKDVQSSLDLADTSLQKSDIVDDLEHADNDKCLSANQGKILSDNKYDKQTNGIPKDDLSKDVQSSLDLADTSLQKSDIIDNVITSDTDKCLSSNQGKYLNDRINDLHSRGRYLSIWDCTKGLPQSNPQENPYTYKNGDYYIVGVIGTKNYKPNGTTYDSGKQSTTVESNSVSVNDTYYFDGTSWQLLHNSVSSADMKSMILEMLYPVGSIYITLNDKSPAELFGGTWSEWDNDYAIWSSKDTLNSGIQILNESLPNITGSVSLGIKQGNYANASGVFANTTQTSSNQGSHRIASTSSTHGVVVNYNASNNGACTNAYGYNPFQQGNIVRPRAVKCHIWHRMA